MKNGLRGLLAITAFLMCGLVFAGPVNINTDDAQTLARELDGVGTILSQRIVDYRRQNGPFERPEDVTKVPYVGDKILKRNQQWIQVR